MTIETAADLDAMMDVNDFADTVTLADGSTFLAFFHYGFAESLEINGRRPILLAISAAVSAVAVGASVTVAATTYTVQAIEQGDRTSRLFLEKP